ncbi:low density lipoprotein receptor adaptor protein 1, partial [Chelydra serpentina]
WVKELTSSAGEANASRTRSLEHHGIEFFPIQKQKAEKLNAPPGAGSSTERGSYRRRHAHCAINSAANSNKLLERIKLGSVPQVPAWQLFVQVITHTNHTPSASAELPENWADMQEPLLEGIGFTLKYLGMTLVEKPKGEDMAANAIRRIIAMARVGAKKFQKVILTVSPRGISLQDAETKEMIECVSIYRISYCTTDKLQNKVFAYVAQSQQSGALECHAFLSPKKKIAQAVTLTVAQAFQVALDHWEAAQA